MSQVRSLSPPPKFWPCHIVVIIPACLVGYESSILSKVAKFLGDCMSQKQTPKSCSCCQCKASKGRKPVKHMMKLEERAFRHRQKVELSKSGGEYLAAPHGDRYG